MRVPLFVNASTVLPMGKFNWLWAQKFGKSDSKSFCPVVPWTAELCSYQYGVVPRDKWAELGLIGLDWKR